MIKYVCDMCGMVEEKTAEKENNKNTYVFKISNIRCFNVDLHLCVECLDKAEGKAGEVFYKSEKEFTEWIKKTAPFKKIREISR